ncbi:Coiled-coil domain-containing protein 25 [Zea mays]|uniref:Coiled-coil domain-containing protein 25 n=1 Tax=Zea mays TaxID=4577 RepID=A0A317YGC7_MAIZE|nr:Coiled-coil domain-containing protein 25 [Zea mays]
MATATLLLGSAAALPRPGFAATAPFASQWRRRQIQQDNSNFASFGRLIPNFLVTRMKHAHTDHPDYTINGEEKLFFGQVKLLFQFIPLLKLSIVHTQQLMYLSTLHPSEEMLSRREKATNFKPDYDIDIHMKVLAMSVQESSILTGYKMKVRTIKVEKRINEIVNRLNKTKVERKPDLKAEREAISAAEKAERKAQLRDKKRREEMERLDKEKQADIRSYKGLMVQEKMTSNKQIASGSKTLQELEEDFM